MKELSTWRWNRERPETEPLRVTERIMKIGTGSCLDCDRGTLILVSCPWPLLNVLRGSAWVHRSHGLLFSPLCKVEIRASPGRSVDIGLLVWWVRVVGSCFTNRSSFNSLNLLLLSLICFCYPWKLGLEYKGWIVVQAAMQPSLHH